MVQDAQNGGQTGWVVKVRVASPSEKKLSNSHVQLLLLGTQVQNEFVFLFFLKQFISWPGPGGNIDLLQKKRDGGVGPSPSH